MTIRFVKYWNGYSPDAIVNNLGSTEEARLVSLGYATTDLDGPGTPEGELARTTSTPSGGVAIVADDGKPRDVLNVINTENMRFGGRVVANYGTLTGYAAANCTIALTPTPAGGSKRRKQNLGQSIRATSAGALANAEVSFPAFTASPSNGRIDLWVYVEDLSAGPYFNLYLSVDSGYTSFFTISLPTPLLAGWQRYSVAEANLTVGGGTPTLATITRGKVRWGCSAATSVVIDRLTIGASGTPLCALTWDDGSDTAYTYVLPLLNKYKLIGNFSIIGSLIGSTNYLTSTMLSEISEAGHRIILHGATRLSDFASVDLAKANIAAERAIVDAMALETFDRDVYVWPNGTYLYSSGNTALMDYIESQGFVGAFQVGGVAATNELGFDRFNTSRFSFDSSTATSTTLAYISAEAALGRSVAGMGHDVVASGATGIQTNVADLDTLLAGVAAKRDAGEIFNVSARDFLLFNSKS